MLSGRGVGVQWDTLFVRTNPSDPLCMGWVWGMFIIDMAVYAVLIWYLDNIRPGTEFNEFEMRTPGQFKSFRNL